MMVTRLDRVAVEKATLSREESRLKTSIGLN